MIGALELGLIYAVMALGVYVTFRVLNFPDLTVDGSFTTGAGTATILIAGGTPAWVATLAGACAGMLAGVITGLLHTKGGINPLLAGILTQVGLYSINLRIMGASNLPLLRETTLFTPLREAGLLRTGISILILLAMVAVVKIGIDWLLGTDLGLAVQATGDNPQMVRSFGVHTHRTIILGLALSNGLVGLCGALVAQYQGFADISMGIGLIIAGLASVILGQAIISARRVIFATAAVVLGSVLYRLAIQVALEVGLDPNDMKLISAVLVIIALVLPRWGKLRRLTGLRGLGAVATGRGR